MLNTKIKRRARAVVLILPLAFFAACRQDMHDQPRYKPLRPSTFFDDGRSARVPVEGTVARGQLREDTLFYTGRTGPGQQQNQQAGGTTGAAQTDTGGTSQTSTGSTIPQLSTGGGGAQVAVATAASGPAMQGYATTFPFPVTPEVVNRGEERYNIFCSVCHDRTGNGLGMVVRRGYRRPPSLHIDRLRQAPPGYLFDVITNGFGAMPDYSSQITPRDRWAIVAYMRALQLSQQATMADVPEQDRSKVGAQPQQQGGQQR